jgi:cytochrome d ubiquinol oxidase subunit II
MELTTIWFALIAVLWIGYFVLEGFDFGVGILLPILGRTEPERRAILRTIGPVWDGNEVWVLVAGGATFAAFPEWYATLFSGFYLPLFLILVGLIVRGVAVEYRNKRGTDGWRLRWDVLIAIGSFLPALLWGVAFANIVAGVPIDANKDYTGNLFTLLNPFGLLGGATTLLLFLTHGLVFLALKTEGGLRDRANRLVTPVGLVTAVVAVVFLVWANAQTGTLVSWVIAVAAALAFVGGLAANWLRREGWAFIGSAVTIALAVVSLFVALFPDVMPSSTDPTFSLTVTNASSTPYTLTIMTVVAVIFTPIVLIYQGWTYWVFRKRVSV